MPKIQDNAEERELTEDEAALLVYSDTILYCDTCCAYHIWEPFLERCGNYEDAFEEIERILAEAGVEDDFNI